MQFSNNDFIFIEISVRRFTNLRSLTIRGYGVEFDLSYLTQFPKLKILRINQSTFVGGWDSLNLLPNLEKIFMFVNVGSVDVMPVLPNLRNVLFHNYAQPSIIKNRFSNLILCKKITSVCFANVCFVEELPDIPECLKRLTLGTLHFPEEMRHTKMIPRSLRKLKLDTTENVLLFKADPTFTLKHLTVAYTPGGVDNIVVPFQVHTLTLKFYDPAEIRMKPIVSVVHLKIHYHCTDMNIQDDFREWKGLRRLTLDFANSYHPNRTWKHMSLPDHVQTIDIRLGDNEPETITAVSSFCSNKYPEIQFIVTQ
jgi:hypothetical protein